ncbi:hypothetical protein NLJ89_g7367 [Agrocybe chaxingu]|uniref:Orc1-like AAA ATPase domain-containing protein n=1 Tax=Agrocybe chaxingu TaxID=84603 RepID=A0A9W8JXC1_9AGAR|nr:hypothetical protein NLJ89_g7367 [Agrocybe chaxingu]
MSQQPLLSSETQSSFSKLSKVWKYAKVVSDQVANACARYATGRHPGKRPSLLPPDREVYGRDGYISHILDEIAKGNNHIAIVGPPGIGKSAVGAAVLYHRQSHELFGNRRHWAYFRDIPNAECLFGVLLNSLSADTETLESEIDPNLSLTAFNERLYSLISTLQTQKLRRLLIMDDFDGVWEAHRNLLEPVLQQLSSVAQLTIVVILQGFADLPQAITRIELPPLQPLYAKLLFLQVYPRSDSAIDDLLRELDFHPLSIVVIARACQLHNLKPSEILKGLKDNGLHGLPEHIGGLEEMATLKGAINDSLNRLSSPEATKLLRIICSLPAGIMDNDLTNVAPSVPNVDRMAALLRNLSLTSIDQGHHLRVLSPLRPLLMKYHDLDPQSRHDLYYYYFNLAREGLRRPGDAYFLSGIKKLREHQQNIEAILFHALEDGDPVAIEATLHYSSPCCAIKPRLDLVAKAVEAAKRNETPQLETAIQDSSMALTARCLLRLGEMHLAAGNYLGAWHPEASKRFQLLGDNVSAAHCQLMDAEHTWINYPDRAIEELKLLCENFLALGDVPGEAKCTLTLAEWCLDKGRLEDGRKAYQRSISKYKDRHHKALAQRIMAQIHLSQGKLEDARSLLVNVIDTLTKFGDRSSTSDCHADLAQVYVKLHRMEDAQEAYKRAILEYEALGQALDAAFGRRWAARISESNEAVKLLQDAIPVFRECSFIFANAESRFELAVHYMEMGQLEDALLHLQIARPELQANLTPEYAARALGLIIICQFLTNNHDAANLTFEVGRYELHSRLLQGQQDLPRPQDLTLEYFIASQAPIIKRIEVDQELSRVRELR